MVDLVRHLVQPVRDLRLEIDETALDARDNCFKARLADKFVARPDLDLVELGSQRLGAGVGGRGQLLRLASVAVHCLPPSRLHRLLHGRNSKAERNPLK